MSNYPKTGTTWQEIADKTIIKDGEKGTTVHKKPAKAEDKSNTAPSSNWPYQK